jgi:hypothetical protein
VSAYNFIGMKELVKNRWAYISFAVSLAEIIVFLGAIVLVRTPFNHWNLILKATAITWLLGVPGSIAFAVIGIFKDSRRGAALMALIVAVACSLFCTLQMLV